MPLLCGETEFIMVKSSKTETAPTSLGRRVKKILIFVIPVVLAAVLYLVLTGGADKASDEGSETSAEAEAVYEPPVQAETVEVVIDIFEERIDPEAPTLYGVRERFCYVGGKVDYNTGVFAVAKMGRSTQIHIDASQVDYDTPGTYSVTYAAIDSEGHCTEVVTSVSVYKSTDVRLDVQNIMQLPTLPNGCEVVSLAIVLAYEGYQIPPTKLFDDYMPHSYGFSITDFWNYYIGDPRGEGCGCYAPCVVATANAFLEARGSDMKGRNVSGSSMEKLESYLEQGIPVIIWGTLGMRGQYSEVAKGYVDGEWVYWNLFGHCMVMIGYTEDVYIFCDPLRGIVEYDKADVEKSYNIAYNQACVIY